MGRGRYGQWIVGGMEERNRLSSVNGQQRVGKCEKAKARLVARGFGQRARVNYFETYSPCPSVASIRHTGCHRVRVGVGFMS